MPSENIDFENLKSEFKAFVYGASHDLNAYTRGMVEFSKLILEEENERLSDDGKIYLSMIIENGAKLRTTLDSLVEMARLQTQAAPFEEVDCKDIAKRAAKIAIDKANSKLPKIKFSALPKLNADKNQLIQLFTLLIDNSIKFSKNNSEPEISVSATCKDNNWIFQIKDNGIGIEPKNFDTIFEPFKRLNCDIQYPGSAIGLTLAKKIITRHCGTIQFLPCAQGSIVEFSIPLAK